MPPALQADRFSARRSSALVGAGILSSRLAGLVRERIFAHYFGNSAAADAFKAAFRIPNLLQNLFGEGVLSASFIPVYVSLQAQGDEAEARRLAGAVLAVLSLATVLMVLAGVLAAPWLIEVIAPGFHGPERALTIELVRIFFPGAGLLVFSAWCLGVLNSHHRFFLSYAAPVVWNGAIIAALLYYGRHHDQFSLAVYAAWGAVAGSVLQVAVQWPSVKKLLGPIVLSLGRGSAHLREVIVNAMPVFAGRGVVQISAYVDALLASLLPTGAVATLAYSQTLYLLPVSLFGMSVSAAELPAMSRATGSEEAVADLLRKRLLIGLRQISFFMLPSVLGFLILGDVIVAAVYRTGAFNHRDVIYVWGTLAGASVGLLASSRGRLYSSTYYALRDTRSPLNYALIRVALTTVLGIIAAFWLPGWLGLAPAWGVAGLTVAAGFAAWVEFVLLRRGLRRRIQAPDAPKLFMLKLTLAAAAAAAAARALLNALPHRAAGLPLWGPWPTAAVVLGCFGVLYFVLCYLLRVPEITAVPRLLRRR